MEAAIKSMVDLGVLEAVQSSRYTSPMVIVEKTGHDPRAVIDYRRLNAVTKTEVYPIPQMEERIERVSAAEYISVFDLVKGYWQVPMSSRAQDFATITTPFGVYRPKTMPFGLKNAPFFFTMLMDQVLLSIDEFAVPYLDDVAVYSKTWEEHLVHIRTVLTRFREAGLKVKPSKCQFARPYVTYLGHYIGQGERRPSEVKVRTITGFPRPVTKTDIRAFLGLCGYYQRFIANYAAHASPLTDALRKTAPNAVSWDSIKQQSFECLKKALVCEPVLRAPDYRLPFLVQTDCSDRGMGVVLSQRHGDEEHPVLYLSRKLTPREQLYCASEKECACIVYALSKLGCYIQGSEFVIETDHSPLTWLSNVTSRNPRLLRWSLTLQPYACQIRYKRGRTHNNADALSRFF
jgi:hypothetical protein